MDAEVEQRARARIGTTLNGKYRVDSILGVGGMAVVYRATHRNQSEVAVKMLHPDLSMRGTLRERFLREGRAANTVKHPGVVAVIDDDVAEDGSAFIVMELLEGTGVEALAARSRGRLPVPIACAILHQLLDVLRAAHEKGVVHRDVKPANLFLTTAGVLKLLDFGVARVRDALSGDTSVTSTGILLGTPAFMAPEQARAKASEIDARTDIWAAGATFFNLVSGKYVHSGDNASQFLIAAATQVSPSVTSVAAVPAPIAEVVDRALAFDRNARWGTARAMAQALVAAHHEAFGGPPARSLLVPDALDASQPTLPTVASDETMRTAQPVSMSGPKVERVRDGSRNRLALSLVAASVAVVAVAAMLVKATASPHDEPVAVPITGLTPSVSAEPSTVPLPSSTPVETPTATAKPTSHAHPQHGPCDPPYYFDSEGKKIFKKECLR